MAQKNKTAFITGISGQDGAYLAKRLLDKGYDVHGLVRWDSHLSPIDSMQRLNALDLASDNITIHMGDMIDASNLTTLIKTIQPDEIYNLAAVSHVKVSFETPSSTMQVNALGTLNLLESVRILDMEERVRIYQASSSEMFGHAQTPQDENTPMNPVSPYGVAKLAAYQMAKVYRESYNMYISNGILFNHESPLRGQDFVTSKIALGVTNIESGSNDPITLGNLDAMRDWGAAEDYVRGMWMMLQQDQPSDYVLATGQSHSVREFTERAFAQIGIEIEWQGSAETEIGIDAKTGRTLVQIDPALFRPNELHTLLGDASKAKRQLGWEPHIAFDQLVSDMINAQRQTLSIKTHEWSMVG